MLPAASGAPPPGDRRRQLGLDRLPERAADVTGDRLHDLLGAEPLLIGDMILLEVLQGVRFEAEAARVEAALRRFDIQPMLDPELAVLAAAHYRTLRNLGVSVRKTVDLVIGTFCIACGHALLTADRDFMPMARHPGTDAGLRDGWRSLRFDAAAPSLRGGEADAAVGRVNAKPDPPLARSAGSSGYGCA